MEEWIEYMKDVLNSKDRRTWDETDWDAYYYIKSLE